MTTDTIYTTYTTYMRKSVNTDSANPAPWPASQASTGPAGAAPPAQTPQGSARLPAHLRINAQLERLHRQKGANEAALGQLLTAWGARGMADTPACWLTLARIAELTLLTAGAYADSCEFRAAGDLLANPRRIRVHLKGRPKPVTKPRHLALSTALRPRAEGHQAFKRWFRANALLEVAQGAILPVLTEIMTASGRIAAPYLDSFATRVKKVADTIGFLHAWQVDDAADLTIRLKNASPDSAAFIEATPRRFSDAHFRSLGTMIRQSLKYRPPNDRHPSVDIV
jgi:hypothetical protein